MKSAFGILGGLAATSLAAAAASRAETPTRLDAFIVSAPIAGSFSAGNAPRAVLTPIEVLLVPGSAADINRALQTLPGVQMADEGNALFVRGGDSRETATWINGLRFPAATQIHTPLGTVAGTISPWQAKKVDFAAGGFGADTGNVLSAAVKIETTSLPEHTSYSANLGVGGVALSVASKWTDKAGATLNLARDDLRVFMTLFDFKRAFVEPPRGHYYSLSGGWDYRDSGRVTWYAVGQSQRLAVQSRDVRGEGVYQRAGDTGFQVVSWHDAIGAWKHEVNVGAGQVDSTESFAERSWVTKQRNGQLATRSAYDGGGFLFRTGTEAMREGTDFARDSQRALGQERSIAGWVEIDTMVARDMRAVLGLRGWNSQQPRDTAVDPRLALTWKPTRRVAWSLAGGRYHQTPHGTFYAEGLPRWPAMRADQAIASHEWKSGAQLLRIETYIKRYDRLVGLDRELRPRGDGTGRARGLDIMFKTPLPADTNGRLTWSMTDADRTDPSTGLRAPAPWAVKHSAALVLDRVFGDWSVSIAGRWATGRAFTPVIGGAEPGDAGRWQPRYGAPNSERLPAFRRVDFTIVRLWEMSPRLTAAVYLAGFNVLGWANTSGYEYSDDFSHRRAVPGVFQRAVYFGVNLTYR